MRTLYLDCSMGAAGDMLMACLAELTVDAQGFIKRLNALGIPGVYAELIPSVKCGIHGSHVSVHVHGVDEGDLNANCECNHHHHGSSLIEIHTLIDSLAVSDAVKTGAKAVYDIVAQAESEVHGSPVGQIHFHEVGAMDAVADIVGVCMLMEELAPECVLASSVHVGSGQVRCAHGILPVPAPATALILKGVPIYAGEIRSELCTPTGAALLKHFVSSFGPMPQMIVENIGYGMGKRDFEAANCLRAFLGNTNAVAEAVSEISCNLDDVTAEELGFVLELLLEAGALDVYTIPIGMKKSRPGTLLCCMCRESATQDMAALILRHTPTLGVRIIRSERITLARDIENVQTRFGTVRIKKAYGMGLNKSKPEYEDISRIARQQAMTLSEVKRELNI